MAHLTRLLVPLMLLHVAACAGGEPSGPGTETEPPTDHLPFSWPTVATKSSDGGGMISQGYGERGDVTPDHHTGVDIRAFKGTSVVAAASGWLQEYRANGDDDEGYGNTLIIGHHVDDYGDVYSQYSHLLQVATDLLSKVGVCALRVKGQASRVCERGQVVVTRGNLLGEVGLSGYGGTPWDEHLHFEVKRDPTIGQGETVLHPDQAKYLDPLLFLHSVSTPQPEPATIRHAYKLRFGPGGYAGVLVQGDYRAIAIAPQGLGVTVTAEVPATVAGPPCTTSWLKVQRSDGVYFADAFEPKEGKVGRGEIQDAWICGEAIATAGGDILVTSSQSATAPSDLYYVQPRADGTDRLLGRVRLSNGTWPTLFDIAVAQNGHVWAIAANRLYEIDPSTLLATDAGSLGLPFGEEANALDVTPAGQLLLATTAGTVRLATAGAGSTEYLGRLPTGLYADGDLAFDTGGRLYGTARGPTGTVLVRLTLDPFSVQAVRPDTPLGFDQVFGLKFIGTELYGLTTDPTVPSRGSLIAIDVSTATATLIRSVAFPVYGAGQPERHPRIGTPAGRPLHGHGDH